jgi:Polysaccharide biosynthesis enzyme WcbI
MQSLADGVEATPATVGELQQQSTGQIATFADAFDHVFAVQAGAALLPDRIRAERTTIVPAVAFSGYHPDLIYIQQGGGILKGSLGDYHSAIAFAAFEQRARPDEAARMFSSDVYERAGYFRAWEPAKTRLLTTFAEAGIPLDDDFYVWTRNGPFMHAINHPRIDVIASVAARALQRIGVASNEYRAIPDNLGKGSIFPVYPELAESLGVRGSMRFKPPSLGPATARTLGLDQFVAASFATFNGAKPGTLQPLPPFRTKLAAVSDAIRSARERHAA